MHGSLYGPSRSTDEVRVEFAKAWNSVRCQRPSDHALIQSRRFISCPRCERIKHLKLAYLPAGLGQLSLQRGHFFFVFGLDLGNSSSSCASNSLLNSAISALNSALTLATAASLGAQLGACLGKRRSDHIERLVTQHRIVIAG